MRAWIIAFVLVGKDGSQKVMITHTYSKKFEQKLLDLLRQQDIPFEVISCDGMKVYLSSPSISNLTREVKEQLGWYDE